MLAPPYEGQLPQLSYEGIAEPKEGCCCGSARLMTPFCSTAAFCCSSRQVAVAHADESTAGAEHLSSGTRASKWSMRAIASAVSGQGRE